MVTTQGQEVNYRDIIKKPDYFRDYKDFSIIKYLLKQKPGNMNKK